MIKYTNENIIAIAQTKQYNYLANGCNCFCTMGAGVAKAVIDAYPGAYEADKKTKKGDSSKLGRITFSKEKDIIVLNCYIQYRYGADFRKLNYEALYLCLVKISDTMKKGESILFPKIGCGLAGGDWNIVLSMIENVLKDFDVTISTFKGEQ